MNEFKLYSYFRSSASYRVRVALLLKEIRFQYIAIHLVKDGGEQHSDRYKVINPMGEVPVLEHSGKHISQSMAILQYLDDIEPRPLLFPKDVFLKAKVLEACEIVNSGIHPLQNLKVMQKLEREFKINRDDGEKWAAYWIMRGFQAFERTIATHAGKFCFGNELTAADIFLCPQVYNARRFKIDMGMFPILEKVEKNCLELDAFRNAYPGVQPDTPNE